MANYIYGAISLTGGGTGSLDAIDGDILAANDACIVFMNNTTYIYSLDASSGAAENSPEIIAPDSNPGTKRWLLVRTNADQIDLVTTSFTGILSASDDDVQKALDTIDNLSITHDKIWEDNSYVEVVDDGTSAGYIEVIADGIQVQYWDAQAATIRMGKLSGAGKVEVSDTGVSASVGAVEILSLTENTQRLGVSGDSRIVISQSADSVDIYAGDGAGAVGTFEVDGLTLTSGTNVNEFSIDGTLAGNSDNATPTEKAVKTYVDTSLGGISSDKIMEGDSYVEVIDDGTNAGYIEVVADGVQVQYWDAEASSIRMGKASGAGRITITDATVLTSIGSEDLMYVSPTGVGFGNLTTNMFTSLLDDFFKVVVNSQDLLSLESTIQRLGTYNDTAIDVDQTGSTIIATANTTEVVSVNENLQTIGVSADTFITVNQTDEETVVTDNSIEAFKIEFEGVSLENGAIINEFSIDGTLVDDSDTAVPTEKAVKTYVDTSISEIDHDKIWEDNSYVEVVDDGTNAGYVEVVADGVQVQYWDAEASSIRMGKASGAGRITVTDTIVTTSIGSADVVKVIEPAGSSDYNMTITNTNSGGGLKIDLDGHDVDESYNAIELSNVSSVPYTSYGYVNSIWAQTEIAGATTEPESIDIYGAEFATYTIGTGYYNSIYGGGSYARVKTDAQVSYVTGFSVWARQEIGVTKPTDVITAIENIALAAGTGLVGELKTIHNSARAEAGSNVTDLYGVWTSIQVHPTSTVGDVYMDYMELSAGSVGATGDIWGLYVKGAEKNYIEGDLTITPNGTVFTALSVDEYYITIGLTDETNLFIDQTQDKFVFEAANAVVGTFGINGLTLATGEEVREFSSDGTLSGNVDYVVPTEKAVKTYVDTAVSPFDSNKISQDDTYVEVIDDGTNSGYIEVAGDMFPDSDDVRSLGSPTKQWSDVYVGPGSFYVNNQKVIEDSSGTIVLSADTDQNVQVKSLGTGDIELLPAGSGVIQMKGNFSVLAGKNIMSSDGNAISFSDDIQMNNNSITGLPAPSTGSDVANRDYVTTYASNASNLSSGTVPSSVLPPIALTTVQVAVSEIAMLALTTEEGDVVVRSDENRSYMRNAGIAGTMADFNELQTPTDSVLSVNGEIGTVILNQDHVGDGVTYVRTHNDLTDILAGNISTNNAKVSNVTTNITVVEAPTNVEIQSSDGSNDTIAAANITNAGVMTTTMYDEHVVNNAKVTNATHTGDVTGSVALTIGADKVNDTHIDWGTGANQVSQDVVVDGSTYVRTQNDFNDTLLSKLNGIAANATNVTNNNQIANGAAYITAVRGIDDTPVNGETNKSITSNWAYDHENATAVHGATSANTASRIVSRDASGNFSAGVITATVTQARYADLAEKHTCQNEDLITGTVVCAATSGEYEVEQCDREKCSNVIGVISAEAGYVMNSDLKNSVTVGLVGKVPVRIIGPVQKGQPIISTGNGCARGVETELELLYKIGATLEANGDTEEKLVYCAIK